MPGRSLASSPPFSSAYTGGPWDGGVGSVPRSCEQAEGEHAVSRSECCKTRVHPSGPALFSSQEQGSLLLLFCMQVTRPWVASSTFSRADVNVLMAAATGVTDSHRLKQ